FAAAVVAADIGETEPVRQAGLRDREAAGPRLTDRAGGHQKTEFNFRDVTGVTDGPEFRPIDFPTLTKLLDDGAAALGVRAGVHEAAAFELAGIDIQRRPPFPYTTLFRSFAAAVVAADIGETEPVRQAGLRDREAAGPRLTDRAGGHQKTEF